MVLYWWILQLSRGKKVWGFMQHMFQRFSPLLKWDADIETFYCFKGTNVTLSLTESASSNVCSYIRYEYLLGYTTVLKWVSLTLISHPTLAALLACCMPYLLCASFQCMCPWPVLSGMARKTLMWLASPSDGTCSSLGSKCTHLLTSQSLFPTCRNLC